MNDEIKFMREALALAACGRYTAAPNPCVGCVIVKDGIILGRGYHVRAGLPHAEVCAMRDAARNGNDITGAVAYVTLEPCSHYGLTPPCAMALAQKHIGRVVCACTDPNPLVSGRGIKILEDAGIPVTVGILEAEALEINKQFFYAMHESRPYVTVKYGMSIDGKTALQNGESKWITSYESRQDVQRLRALNQAVMTSAETVLADNPSLTLRYNDFTEELKNDYPHELLTQPLRVIIDAAEKINDLGLNVFKADGNVLLVRCSTDHEIHENKISDKVTEVSVPVVAESENHIDFKILLDYLNTQRIRSVLVEAGGRFTASILSTGLVNELMVYAAPCILGSSARSAFALASPEHLADAIRMHLFEAKVIGDDIRLTYRF